MYHQERECSSGVRLTAKPSRRILVACSPTVYDQKLSIVDRLLTDRRGSGNFRPFVLDTQTIDWGGHALRYVRRVGSRGEKKVLRADPI